jgi:hypothetical protein
MYKNKIKIPSEKSFGLVFFAVFLIIGYYFYDKNKLISISSYFISLFLLTSSFFFKKILIIPNLIWFKFGIILSKITSPIIIVLLYFGIIVPTGIIYFFLRKKQFEEKVSKKQKTYWIIRDKPPLSMEEQY